MTRKLAEITDDRTDAELETHCWLVVMTHYVSVWPGYFEPRPHYYAWACRFEDVNTVERWVRNRSDSSRVRVVLSRTRTEWRPRHPCVHAHIYVVDDGHPALEV